MGKCKNSTDLHFSWHIKSYKFKSRNGTMCEIALNVKMQLSNIGIVVITAG